MVLPKHQTLPVKKIEFDKTNPRIQLALETYGSDITADRIALALTEGSEDVGGASDSYNKLRNSIRKHKGIINPIVVNCCDGQFVCVEGNTRLQIYHDFQKQNVEGNWNEIPVLLYENADLETTESIRLQAHVIGPRDWTPYAKARYLNRLYEEELLTYDQIVEYCGGSKRDVERWIRAFRMAEEIYRPVLKNPANDFRQEIFSGFVEYQKPQIQESVFASNFNDKDFCRWLHEKKFDRLEHVRRLPKILDNQEAKEIFLKSGSRAALNHLDSPNINETLANTDLTTLLRAVELKINRLDYEDIQHIKTNPDGLVDALESAQADMTWLKEELRNDG